MYENVHIVGCGTIGSNLAISLSLQGKVKNLFLYDMDVVNREGTSYIFPFSEKCKGLFKTHVVRDCIKYLVNSSVNIYTEEIEITKPISSGIGLVIDCRDRKFSSIQCHVRLSLDRHILVIDSLEETEADFPSYVLSQEPEYLSLAISIITAYLQKNDFRFPTKILYDLDDIIDNYDIIERGLKDGSS